MNYLTRISICMLVASSFITGCGKNVDPLQVGVLSSSSSLGAATGNFRLVVTDDPFAYDNVSSAKVTIGSIDVTTSGAATTTILSKPVTLDLVNLKNGMMSVLSDLTLPPGQYSEIQLIISSATIDLKNGNHYNLTVPSGAQTGLKVFINPNINVTTQVSTDVIIDFDLSRSFVALGNVNSANGITGFNFKPVLRATNLTTAGTVSGKVLSDNGTVSSADDIALDGAIVSVSQGGTVISTAITDPSGNYKIIGLPAGTYSLDVSATGFTAANSSSTSIVAGNITTAPDTLLNLIQVTPTPSPTPTP